MKTLFLILATGITLISSVPYLLDILKGKTKPNLVSWMTWSLLTGIATAAAISAGEYTAAIFTGAATFETTLIVFFGIRRGYVQYTTFDIICQVAAVVGIILWQVFNSPTVGVIAAVIIDFIGALPTLRHSWLRPGVETWLAFALAGLGGTFAILALDTYNWVNMPYALYILIINIITTSIIISRQRQLKRSS